MRMRVAAGVAFALCLMALPRSAAAQTCEQVTHTCSAMTQRCIQRCNGGQVRARNPETCVAEHCTPADSQCKATGRWSNMNGCWTTTRRS